MALKHSTIATLCLIILCLQSGCAQESAERWLKEGHPFVSGEKVTPTEIETPPLPVEKPLVKVISGKEVESPEEAMALVQNQNTSQKMGLQTSIDQLVVKEMPLQQVSGILSELTGYNIAVTQAAADIPVTISLRELPLRQALETICRLYNLWYREDERIVTLMTTQEYSQEMVIRRNEKSRAYWLRYTNANDMARILQAVMSSKIIFNDIGDEEVYGHVDEEKDESDQIQVKDEEEDNSTGGKESTIKGFTEKEFKKMLTLKIPDQQQRADALDMYKKIHKEVPAVITVFKRNNAILARSLDETVLQDIGRIIELMDTPTSEVLLEISILQLNLDDGFESFFSIDYNGSEDTSYSTLNAAGGLSSNTLNVLFGNSSISATLELYAKEDRVNVLSTPYLMSANNSKVEFFVGEEVPLREDVESNTLYDDDGNVSTTTFDVTINREELGTDLEISSFINEDGTITMDLETEISSAEYNMTTVTLTNDASGETVEFPIDGVETQNMTSIVTAASGQTIALGGIIREEVEEYEKKVPVLGDIPGLGFFFKSVEDTKAKTETIILLTPHIIRHPEQAGAVTREFLNRRSSHPRYSEHLENLTDFQTGNMKEQDEEQKE